MKKTSSILLIFLLMATILIATLSGSMMLSLMTEYHQGKQLYQHLVNHYTTNIFSSDPNRQTILDQIGISPAFTSLNKINSDIIGWIYIPDTDINYPITQTDNNDYYLSHLVNKSSNENGAIFADHKNSPDFSDDNTILWPSYEKGHYVCIHSKLQKTSVL